MANRGAGPGVRQIPSAIRLRPPRAIRIGVGQGSTLSKMRVVQIPRQLIGKAWNLRGILARPRRVAWPGHARRKGRKTWGPEWSLCCSGPPIAGAGGVMKSGAHAVGVNTWVGRPVGTATPRLTGRSGGGVRATLGLRATGGRTRLKSRLMSNATLSPEGWGERGRHFSATSNTQGTVFTDQSRKTAVPLATLTQEVEVRRCSSKCRSSRRNEGRGG